MIILIACGKKNLTDDIGGRIVEHNSRTHGFTCARYNVTAQNCKIIQNNMRENSTIRNLAMDVQMDLPTLSSRVLMMCFISS